MCITKNIKTFSYREYCMKSWYNSKTFENISSFYCMIICSKKIVLIFPDKNVLIQTFIQHLGSATFFTLSLLTPGKKSEKTDEPFLRSCISNKQRYRPKTEPNSLDTSVKHLKKWFLFKSRLIHFHINSIQVIRPIKSNKLS